MLSIQLWLQLEFQLQSQSCFIPHNNTRLSLATSHEQAQYESSEKVNQHERQDYVSDRAELFRCGLRGERPCLMPRRREQRVGELGESVGLDGNVGCRSDDMNGKLTVLSSCHTSLAVLRGDRGTTHLFILPLTI